MITIKAEWVQKTKMGHTNCSADKTVWRNYRDIDTVEEVVNWIKQLLSNKDYSDQCVDFMFDNDTAYGFTYSRYFKDWSSGFDYVYFGGYANGLKNHFDTVTKKDIKNEYLACAEKCMEYEEEKEAQKNAD